MRGTAAKAAVLSKGEIPREQKPRGQRLSWWGKTQLEGDESSQRATPWRWGTGHRAIGFSCPAL